MQGQQEGRWGFEGAGVYRGHVGGAGAAVGTGRGHQGKRWAGRGCKGSQAAGGSWGKKAAGGMLWIWGSTRDVVFQVSGGLQGKRERGRGSRDQVGAAHCGKAQSTGPRVKRMNTMCRQAAERLLHPTITTLFMHSTAICCTTFCSARTSRQLNTHTHHLTAHTPTMHCPSNGSFGNDESGNWAPLNTYFPPDCAQPCNTLSIQQVVWQ